MLIFGAITIAALLTSSTAFTPLYDTPFVGKLPLNNDPEEYDIAEILVQHGVSPYNVKEILVYVFFTGLGGGAGPTNRAFYEIYTESATAQYKLFFNAVFNQPDTVINSANLWIPYAGLGYLYAHKIGQQEFDAEEQQSVTHNSLHEAINAYVQGKENVFRDIYLIGYR